ncbi:MAG TPA: chemotaxis-specific protein-glutamate methyltransferase CheB [Acidimicrobiales bacterium]|nr:chemotaxis-specific protein-glutamate methyltransferase CheB [Acidimicrobiales bacterium]
MRVLLVDDSVVIRRVVGDVIKDAPGVELAGTAPNGRIGLAKIGQLVPDVVVLDVEMPEMDGLATLTALRADWPRLPVIMFSTLTDRGAAVTLDALLRGADDYVTKPSHTGGLHEAQARVQAELVPKIKLLGNRGGGPAPRPGSGAPVPRRAPTPLPGRAAPAAPAARIPTAARTDRRIDAVVIGVSTGGPNALAEITPALPADLPVPVVVVQHMPPMFTRLLAERLDTRSGLRIAEAAGGETLTPGSMWIAPGDHHLVVRGGPGQPVRLALDDGPKENSCRPSVDPLFRSAATVWGPNLLAVVLTGMGRDGERGAARIREAGGTVVAQDEASSVVWGMPGAVVEAGLADAVMPLSGVANEIVRIARIGRVASAAGTR